MTMLMILGDLPKHVPPETVEAMTASWRDLHHTPLANQTERNALAAQAEALKTPATARWITGRVATLLAQYFAGNVPPEMMEAIAADWHHELREFPAWAVAVAVRWWMGRENQHRHRKPLPGDISARARFEMWRVTLAEQAVRNYDRYGSHLPPYMQERSASGPAISHEEAARIMAEVNAAKEQV